VKTTVLDAVRKEYRDKSRKRAKKYMKKEKYDLAIRELKKAITKCHTENTEELSELHSLIGIAY